MQSDGDGDAEMRVRDMRKPEPVQLKPLEHHFCASERLTAATAAAAKRVSNSYFFIIILSCIY